MYLIVLYKAIAFKKILFKVEINNDLLIIWIKKSSKQDFWNMPKE